MTPAPTSPFGGFVKQAAASGNLVVQPRMGFSDLDRMRAGLLSTKSAVPASAGTLTIDSYTRVGDLPAARAALAEGQRLNGYPIATYPSEVTRALLRGVADSRFPVQVRHGSSSPEPIIRALVAAGLDATEGGPVSYCLPYGRTPLGESVRNWARACELLADLVPPPRLPHVESFGGCLLGQLCPPGLLVAMSVLECLFFTHHGIRSVSLSYAQQTEPTQDLGALRALRRLAGEFLPGGTDWHVVVYTYMGVFPATEHGAVRLLAESARLAVRAGAERLIVKTAAEAHRIPSVQENVAALASATAAAEAARPLEFGQDLVLDVEAAESETYAEARALIEAVLGLGGDLGKSLCAAFAGGYLDIPYCLHPDNAGRSRSFLDANGRLRWADVGSMPISPDVLPHSQPEPTSGELLTALHTVASRYDRQHDRPDDPDARSRPASRLGVAAMRPTSTLHAPGSSEPEEAISPEPPPLSAHLRSPQLRAAMLVQQETLYATREFLRGQGFTELLPPLVGPVTDPGGRGAKALDVDYYGHTYKLMTSAILYKQASLHGFPRLFYIAPNVRVEPPETATTGRHLVEFHQIDLEMAGATRKEAQDVAIGLLTHVAAHVWHTVPDVLAELGRSPLDFTEVLAGRFDTLTHAEAVERLAELGHPQSSDAEIEWAGERAMSLATDRPFFINDYPKGSRGFYDREDPQRPGLLRNFDLIAPGGYGELVSGSERESDYATIVTRMRESGENPAKYGWYLDMMREGVPASAGFGMGLQRLVRFLTGLDTLWQVSAYPKLPGVVAP